jgi:hypothetical protein
MCLGPDGGPAGDAAMTRVLTLAELSALPAVTDLVTAGRALGLGRTKAYELARNGEFPCPLIRAGKTYLVPTARLLALLGLPLPAPQVRSTMKEH